MEGHDSESLENIITIELFGETYKFKAEVGFDNAKTVADFLVEEVLKVEKKLNETTPGVLRFKLLLLAALNISGEYFKLKNNHEDLLEDISYKLDNICTKIDTLSK